MSIEASLPMLLAVFGVSCSVFGVNTLVMGRLCRSKGIELSRQDIRQMRQGYVFVAVALVCLIVLVATSALSLIDARVGLALIAFELVGAGVGAFTAKKSVDSDYEPESHTEGGITYISLQPGERYELHSEERYHMTLSESEVQVQPVDDGTQRIEKKSSILGTRYTLYM